MSGADGSSETLRKSGCKATSFVLPNVLIPLKFRVAEIASVIRATVLKEIIVLIDAILHFRRDICIHCNVSLWE
jgi:hypothetical protein